MLSRWWLLLTIPGGLLVLWALTRVVWHLVRSTRDAIVATVPVPAPGAVGSVELKEDGTYSLSLEMRRGWSMPNPRKLRVTMAHEAGDVVPVRSANNTRVSSFDKVRLEFGRVEVWRVGRHTIRAEYDGGSAEGLSDAAIVFSRPIGGTIVGHVLLCILLGFLLIGCVVVSGLTLVGATPS